MSVRKVTYEYVGTEQDIDTFLTAVIRDFYGNKVNAHGQIDDTTFIEKVENGLPKPKNSD